MKFYCYIGMMVLAFLAAACSHDTDEPDTPVRPKGGVAVEFNITVQQNATEATRGVPDPGFDTDEGEAWDSLLIVVAYTAKNFDAEESMEQHPDQTVYYEVIRRSDFMKTEEVSLPDGTTLSPVFNGDGTDSHYRRLTMTMPVGKVRIYGVTYATSQLKVFNPEDSVSTARFKYDRTFHAEEIDRMLIPNAYGNVQTTMNGNTGLATMLSVATGTATDDTQTDSPYELEVSKEHGSGYMAQHWSMVLRRLATRLDIQWDASGGFTVNSNGAILTNVVVRNFEYDGRATLPADADARGYGRLFPWLPALAESKPVGGRWNFQNQTPISQRNGRVTHCFFPDGVRDTLQAPRVTFNITKDRTVNNVAQPTEQATVTLDLKSALKRNGYMLPASWYKISMSIKGDAVTSGVVTVN